MKYVWRRKGGARDHESVNWGQIYTLQLMGRLSQHPGWKDRREGLRKEIAELLPWFYARKKPGKGWGYNSTFQTAAALLMLCELREAGAPLREEAIEEVAELLKTARSDLGYDYNIRPQTGPPPAPERKQWFLDGSAARNAACEYALFRCGKAGREDLEAMIRRSMDHRAFLWETRAGTAQGRWPRVHSASPNPYFAFWGCCHVAWALEGCGPDARGRWMPLLRDDLLKAREADGTWINLPAEGPAKTGPKVAFDDKGNRIWQVVERNVEPGSKIYATSMALLTLESLNRPVTPDSVW
jgi:hypothetical protein